MRRAGSAVRAAVRPIASPNGMEAFGHRWVRGSAEVSYRLLYLRWQCPVLICMPEEISRWQAAAQPVVLPNGMGIVGRHWVQDWVVPIIHLCLRWPCRAATWLQEDISRRREATELVISPNGTGVVGLLWVLG